MRPSQVYSRMRRISRENRERNSWIDDESIDICSLNSWSEDMVMVSNTNNVNRNRSQSELIPPPLYPTTNLDRSSVSSCEEFDNNLNYRHNHNHNGSFTSASMSTPYRQTAVRSNNSNRSKVKESGSGRALPAHYHGHDHDTLPQSLDSKRPLSSDFKSASFEYSPLWENPHPSSENPQPVIKSMDFKHHSSSSSSKPTDLSNSVVVAPSSNSNPQRLYPILDELRINESSSDGGLYPKIPQDIYSPSKVSPSPSSISRPHFFDFQKKINAKAPKEGDTVRAQIQRQSSSIDGASTLGVSSSRLKRETSDSRTQNVIGWEVVQPNSPQSPEPLYFKSQPAISTQQSGLSLRPNNSSNDIESLDKQMLEHRLEPENMKSKIISVWNNLKYGWTFKSKSNIKLDSPLFLLGKVYHKSSDEDEEPQFLMDFTSRIWLTYRSNFYPIPGTKLTTDCGWGCMLRSGQMLMAQCFVSHFLGRDWRIHDHRKETQLYYREILRWFSDPVEAPSDTVPFCLHHLVSLGRHHNKMPGEWYGPASAAYIFRDSLNRANSSIPILKDICIYVAQDCTVFIDDVNKLCRTRPKSDSGNDSFDHVGPQHSSASANAQANVQTSSDSYNAPWCRSLIIFIPVRLGGEAMNEIYMPCIKSLLSYSKCMGIIGGKPKHSLYFIGWQDDKLIYLDPHYCRDAVDTTDKDFRVETYHCKTPRMMTMSKMDPSCTVGFYVKDADEFKKFVHDVTEFVSPPKQKGLYPLFIFSNGSQEEAELAQQQIGTERGRVKVKHYIVDENGQRRRTLTRESEEFILL